MKIHARISTVAKLFFVFAIMILSVSINSQPGQVSAQIVDTQYIYLPAVHFYDPNAVVILPNYSILYEDELQEFYGYGEIVNNTPESIAIETVEVETLDASGNLIKTLDVPISIYLASASSEQAKTCFFYHIPRSLRSEPAVASLRLKTPRYYVKSYFPYDNASNFEFVDPILYDDGVLEGYIRNISTRTYNDIFVIATIYNAAGIVVGCGTEYVNQNLPFEPGDISSFSMHPQHENYPGLKTYRLQVHGYPDPY